MNLVGRIPRKKLVEFLKENGYSSAHCIYDHIRLTDRGVLIHVTSIEIKDNNLIIDGYEVGRDEHLKVTCSG